MTGGAVKADGSAGDREGAGGREGAEWVSGCLLRLCLLRPLRLPLQSQPSTSHEYFFGSSFSEFKICKNLQNDGSD